MPYTPSGGRDTNGSIPVYAPYSDFDFQSLALAKMQEDIELDLFLYALEKFSDEEWDAHNITAEDRFTIRWMAEQEVGHSQIIGNMLGKAAPKPCHYNYPFDDIPGFLEYAKKNTRYGESGTYGFLPHMNSGAAASLVQASIATEARQQMIFRQFQGLFSMPVNFIVAVPQSWQWTLLAPDIAWCPANQTRLVWQNNNVTNFTYPGRPLELKWENPGKLVGPNNSYVTNTTAGPARFVAWVNQVNTTYTPLTDIRVEGEWNYGTTYQPGNVTLGENGGIPIVNETAFVAVTDADVFVTPYNLTMINPHVVAGPALLSSG
jgi:hypothetical protein